jgi:hypothetical protein
MLPCARRPLVLSFVPVLLLAACGPETGGVTPAPVSGPPSVVLPVSAPAATQAVVREDSATTTVVSADGRTTTTRTTGTRVAVDPAAFLTALGGAAPVAAPPNRAADFLGVWSASNIQNRQCQFTLHPPIGTGPAFAQNQGCTGPQMVAISRWALRDGVVELANGFGGVQARLRVTAPNRLDGDGITMWR